MSEPEGIEKLPDDVAQYFANDTVPMVARKELNFTRGEVTAIYSCIGTLIIQDSQSIPAPILGLMFSAGEKIENMLDLVGPQRVVSNLRHR